MASEIPGLVPFLDFLGGYRDSQNRESKNGQYDLDFFNHSWWWCTKPWDVSNIFRAKEFPAIITVPATDPAGSPACWTWSAWCSIQDDQFAKVPTAQHFLLSPLTHNYMALVGSLPKSYVPHYFFQLSNAFWGCLRYTLLPKAWVLDSTMMLRSQSKGTDKQDNLLWNCRISLYHIPFQLLIIYGHDCVSFPCIITSNVYVLHLPSSQFQPFEGSFRPPVEQLRQEVKVGHQCCLPWVEQTFRSMRSKAVGGRGTGWWECWRCRRAWWDRNPGADRYFDELWPRTR